MSKKSIKLQITEFDNEGGVATDYDNYAFFQSNTYQKIFVERMHSSQYDDAIDISGYVKLQRGDRKIYLRYHSWRTTKGCEVMLSYRNRCLLGCGSRDEMAKGPEVEVSPSSWWHYFFYNNDSGIRVPFRIAVWGLAITIVSSFVSSFRSSAIISLIFLVVLICKLVINKIK